MRCASCADRRGVARRRIRACVGRASSAWSFSNEIFEIAGSTCDTAARVVCRPKRKCSHIPWPRVCCSVEGSRCKISMCVSAALKLSETKRRSMSSRVACIALAARGRACPFLRRGMGRALLAYCRSKCCAELACLARNALRAPCATPRASRLDQNGKKKHSVAATPDLYPGGHGKHSTAATKSTYFPFSQLEHGAEPFTALYLPCAHGRHGPPFAPVYPGTQKHPVMFRVPRWLLAYALQLVHEDIEMAPETSENLPSTQSTQPELPLTSL